MTRLRKLVAGFLALGLVGGLSAPAAAAPAWTPAYDLEGTCATLQVFDGSTSRGYVRRDSVGYGFTGAASSAEPFRFEAAQLGRYLLRDTTGKPPYQSVLGWVWAGDAYGERADWTVSTADGRYRFVSTATGQQMGVYLGGLGAGNSNATVALTPASGCAAIPDIATGVSGTPGPGVDANGKLVGWIDAHAHITAAEAFGGSLHCGDPYAPGGAPVALKGCPSHATLGWGALLEAIIAGTDPINSAEDGWPTFGDWPQYDTMLHEASYFRSLERAWKSGQRVLNQLLVANRVICGLTLQHTSCDEMDQIRAQATYLRKMQDYVDARSGGPGKGWFPAGHHPGPGASDRRPGQARRHHGRRELRGLRLPRDQRRAAVHPGPDRRRPRRADEPRGERYLPDPQVRQRVRRHPLRRGGHRGRDQRRQPDLHRPLVAGDVVHRAPRTTSRPLVSDDFARLLQLGVGLPAGAILPVYPSGKICNVRGLTDLGRYLIERMMDRGMIIHIDHMSVKAGLDRARHGRAGRLPGGPRRCTAGPTRP